LVVNQELLKKWNLQAGNKSAVNSRPDRDDVEDTRETKTSRHHETDAHPDPTVQKTAAVGESACRKIQGKPHDRAQGHHGPGITGTGETHPG